MADLKDFNPIDELYRNTLNNLHETPSASGWDTPSQEVWKNIQANAAQPQNSWVGRGMAIAAAVVVVAAVVLFMNRPAEKPAPQEQPNTSVPAPVVNPAPAATTGSPAPTEAAEPAKPSVKTKPTPTKTSTPKAVNSTPTEPAGATDKPLQPIENQIKTSPAPAQTEPQPAPQPAAPVEKTDAKKPAQKTLPPPPNSTEREKQRRETGGGGGNNR